MSYLQQHLSYQHHIDSVVVIELFHCHMLHPVVSVALVNWSKGYFLATPWKSCTIIVTFKLLYEKQKILQSCFLLFWFLIHIFQDIFVCLSSVSSMPGFSSVFIPSCVNDRSNSVARNFSKLISILSHSFPKSSISLVELLLGKQVKSQTKIFRNFNVLFNYVGHHTQIMIRWQISLKHGNV